MRPNALNFAVREVIILEDVPRLELDCSSPSESRIGGWKV